MDLYPRLMAAVLVTLLGSGVARADPIYPKQRVVYDLASGNPAKWRIALENVQNHLAAVGAQRISLIMVLHGPGVWLLVRAKRDPVLSHSMAALIAQGVAVRVSADALRARRIGFTQLSFVRHRDLVESGAAEIVHLERHGFIYINP